MKVAIASGKGGTGKTTLAVNLLCVQLKTMDVSLLDLMWRNQIVGYLSRRTDWCQNFYRKVPIWNKNLVLYAENVLIYASLTLF
jgi:cellulose biosynthesis protein BcsQ